MPEKLPIKKVHIRLCYRDRRNPNNLLSTETDLTEWTPYDQGCFCDNCFYGRTVLAVEVLRLRELVDHYEQEVLYEG